MVKNPCAREQPHGTQVPSLGWEDLLGMGVATYALFLSGESHGQRSLVGYSQYHHKSQAQVKQLSRHAHAN